MFRVAQEHAPSIIFIDEIDAVATKRCAGLVLGFIGSRFGFQPSRIVGPDLGNPARYDTTSGGEKEIQRTMSLCCNVQVKNPGPCIGLSKGWSY